MQRKVLFYLKIHVKLPQGKTAQFELPQKPMKLDKTD